MRFERFFVYPYVCMNLGDHIVMKRNETQCNVMKRNEMIMILYETLICCVFLIFFLFVLFDLIIYFIVNLVLLHGKFSFCQLFMIFLNIALLELIGLTHTGL